MSQERMLLEMKIQNELENFRKTILSLSPNRIYYKYRKIQLMEDFAGVLLSSDFPTEIVNKMLKTETLLRFLIEEYQDDESVSENIFEYVKEMFN